MLLFAGVLVPACAQTTQLRFGDKTVKLLRIGAKDSTLLTRWLNVHDDERTGVEAFKLLADSGMQNELIAWRHTAKRMVTFNHYNKRYTFDPNRIFTSKGIEATLRREGSYSHAAFNIVHREATKFKKHFVDGNDMIIVLHNNTDSGGLHIKSYAEGGVYESDAAAVHIEPSEDIDDFFYTTDSTLYLNLAQAGFNAVLQNNKNVTNDGSLSVYCGYKNMRYVNIEAQHGHRDQQMRMIKALNEMLPSLLLAKPKW